MTEISSLPNVTARSQEPIDLAPHNIEAEQALLGALLINNEPDYLNIEGQWLTNNDFVVFHRLAISEKFLNKGLAKKMVSFIEQFAISKNIFSVKADTNHDNTPMLKLFKSLNYSLCGTVYIRKSPRKAFEKVLKN